MVPRAYKVGPATPNYKAKGVKAKKAVLKVAQTHTKKQGLHVNHLLRAKDSVAQEAA